MIRKSAVLLAIVFGMAVHSGWAQNIEVVGAGTADANGVYKPHGLFNDHIRYVKGEFKIIYKGCVSKWMIVGPDGNYYRNTQDTELPPKNKWQRGCAKNSLSPMPVIRHIEIE